VFVYTGSDTSYDVQPKATVVAYKDITVGVAPKTVVMTKTKIANGTAAGKTDTYKKDVVPVSGSVVVYLKSTYDKQKQKDTTGSTYSWSAGKNDKGKVNVSQQEDGGFKIEGVSEASGSSPKVGNAKLTFVCKENGKKVSFTAQVGRPATGIVVTGSNVVTETSGYTTTLNDTKGLKTTDLAKNAGKAEYTLEVTSRNDSTVCTDKPKVYKVSKFDPTSDSFKNKSKPASEELNKEKGLKASIKNGKLVIDVPKGTDKKTDAKFLIVYNNQKTNEGGYGYTLLNYSITPTS
jgi:hypothetical protein